MIGNLLLCMDRCWTAGAHYSEWAAISQLVMLLCTHYMGVYMRHERAHGICCLRENVNHNQRINERIQRNENQKQLFLFISWFLFSASSSSSLHPHNQQHFFFFFYVFISLNYINIQYVEFLYIKQNEMWVSRLMLALARSYNANQPISIHG